MQNYDYDNDNLLLSWYQIHSLVITKVMNEYQKVSIDIRLCLINWFFFLLLLLCSQFTKPVDIFFSEHQKSWWLLVIIFFFPDDLWFMILYSPYFYYHFVSRFIRNKKKILVYCAFKLSTYILWVNLFWLNFLPYLILVHLFWKCQIFFWRFSKLKNENFLIIIKMTLVVWLVSFYPILFSFFPPFNQSINCVFVNFFLEFLHFFFSFFSNQLNLPGKSLFKTLFKWNEKSLHIGDWSFHSLSWFSLHSNSISMNFFVWKILSKYFGLFKLFFRLLCVCVDDQPPPDWK